MSEIGNYLIGKTIGQGTFSKVCQAINQVLGHEVAVKVLEKSHLNQEGDIERVKREISIMKQLHHPQIVKLYEIIETETHINLFMEYASRGELFDYIDRVKQVSEVEACKFFHQIIAGIEYMHNLKVIHRDLKPENILLTGDRDVLIADFGLSNIQKDNLKTGCGSPCYAAPEMIQGQAYNGFQTDIWSCGIILFAMICGYLPFDDPNTQNLYEKIISADYAFPKTISSDARDLIYKILVINPQQRLTLQQIKKHRWWQLWKKDNPLMTPFKARYKEIPCLFLPNSPFYEEPISQIKSPRNEKSPVLKSPKAKSPPTKSPITKSTTSKLSSCTYKQVYDKIKMRQTPSKSLHESANTNKNTANSNINNKQNIFLKQQQNNMGSCYNKHKKQVSGQYSAIVKQTQFQKIVQSIHNTMNNTHKAINQISSFKTPAKLFYSHTRNVSEVDKLMQSSLRADDSQSAQNIIQKFTSGLSSLKNSPRQPQNVRGIESHTGPYHLSLITKKYPQLFVKIVHNFLQKNYQIIAHENYSITIKLQDEQLVELRLKRIETVDVYYLYIASKMQEEEVKQFVKHLLQNIKF